MKRIYKVLAICICILVFLTLLAAGFVYNLFRREVPPANATIQLAGLERSVDVIFDRRGVPHAYGHSDEDLARVLGYLHARDRLWQLDLVRRAAAGQLSEIFGESLYNFDVFKRVIGLRRTAQKLEKSLDKNSLKIIQAYCDGVNAFIDAAGPLPTIEFRVLGYQMKPWTVDDVLTLARQTGWQLSGNWDVEVLRAAVAAERGEEAMWAVLPRHRDPGPYIIPPDQKSYSKGADNSQPSEKKHARAFSTDSIDGLLALLDINRRDREFPAGVASIPMASNSWVLSPSKTKSGGAMMCNDPHLDMLLPSVWHEAHLHGDDIDVIGVAFPGTPMIVLGHTPQVAWGATTTCADTQDLYAIVTDSDHPGKYLYDGQWRPFEIADEKIRIRTKNGHEERTVRVRLTVHGPIITDQLGFADKLPPLAMRWTGYEKSDEMDALFRMAKAGDTKSLLDAIGRLKVPIQNWVYAGSDGHIGYIAGGLLPIRKKGDGTMPVPGDDPEYAWAGFVPHSELPQITDPPAGFIATANNKVVPQDYPYIVSHEYAPPYRAARIVEVLRAGEKFTAEDVARLQMDTKLLLGRRLTPFFIKAYENAGTKGDERIGKLVEMLKKWDYSTNTDEVAPAFFHEAYRQAFRLTYEDEVSPKLWRELREEGTAYIGFDNGIEEDFALFDDRRTADKVESRDDILVAAMSEAIGVLESELGPSIENWKWGKLHTILFDHPFGGQHPMLRKTFSLGPYPLAGSRDTVNNGYFHWWAGPYKISVGPSLRHIVDYGNMASCKFTITIGQSLHRLSKHYSDQVMDWIEGRYHPMPTLRSDVDAAAEGKIEFRPGDK